MSRLASEKMVVNCILELCIRCGNVKFFKNLVAQLKEVVRVLI